MVRWTSRTWGLQRGSMASMKRPRSRMPHWRCKASLPMWRWVFGNGHSLYPIAYGTYGLEARGKTWKTNNEPSKWKWTSSIWKFKTSFWRSWTTIFRNGECCSTYIFRIPIDRYWFFFVPTKPYSLEDQSGKLEAPLLALERRSDVSPCTSCLCLYYSAYFNFLISRKGKAYHWTSWWALKMMGLGKLFFGEGGKVAWHGRHPIYSWPWFQPLWLHWNYLDLVRKQRKVPKISAGWNSH